MRSRLKLVPGHRYEAYTGMTVHRYEAYTGMTAVCQGWLSEEALASLVFALLCMRLSTRLCSVSCHGACPCANQVDILSPVTSVACGAGWRGLCAKAWFVTKYDSKGDGLMRLAGHT